MEWHTETRKISELKNWEDNPRVISKGAYGELKASIEDLGNFEPLVVDTDGTVIAGNQRLKVHIERGDEEVEVSVPERKLTQKEIKKIGLISNRHSGEWDMDKLANEFEDILDEIGATDLLPSVGTGLHEDDYEEPDDLEVTVKLGDVYQLGEHRLVCGDSTKIEDVEKLTNGQKADMMFTDPPYNMNYEGVGGQKRQGIMNDKMSTDKFYLFIRDFLLAVREYIGGGVYICIGAKEIGTIKMAMEEAGYHWQDIIVWVKDKLVLGGTDYQRRTEYIIVGDDGEEEIVSEPKEGEVISYGWSEHNWYGGRKKTNIWEFKKQENNSLHPTMKPVQLCGTGIINSSKRGGVVLDVFGGSGSTMIACEQLNRKCYMMELDPHYCQVIIDRWEKLTGKEAVKLEE